MSAAWRGLLDGPLRARARQVLDDITAALRDDALTFDHPSLDGWANRALFFGYLARHDGGRDAQALSDRYLERAVAGLATVPMLPGLHGGFTGIAWVVEHLAEDGDGAKTGRAAGEDDADPGLSVDEALCETLAEGRWTRPWDLIGGLAGIGVYALERSRRPSGRECLARVVERLAELAERRGPGVAWWTRPEWLIPTTREAYPQGYYNLGVAHGAPAVAVVLAGACAANGRAPSPLLEDAVRWILSCRLERAGAVFPYYDERRADLEPARAAWCYGDPGVAAALLAAARAVGRRDWAREAVAIAARAAARPMDECGVQDAGLCHGAAGLALLFARLWHATGDERFADAARRWYARTLALHEPGAGVGGIRAHFGALPPERADEQLRFHGGLLTGACGVGLALLAGLGDVEPAWDRLLAVSLPEVPR